MNTEPLLYSVKDSARLLSISTRSLNYLIADHRIAVRRIGGRVLIAADALKAFASRDNDGPIVPVPQAA